MKKPTLLVFDWDGTLMDSEARIVSCMLTAAAEAGLEPPPCEEARGVIGLALREAVTALFPEITEGARERVVERYRHHYLVASTVPSRLFPGAKDLLAALYDRKYFLAVATGKGRRGLDQVMEEHGVHQLFHYTRCADEARSKPHPQMLWDIMDHLGVGPADTLMIGDTDYDLLMAENAGVPALAVGYGVQSRARLMACRSLACVDSIEDLRKWLLALESPFPELACSQSTYPEQEFE